MSRHPYDDGYEPPAPVVPVRVSSPGSPDALALPALVDSGADITVLPEDAVRVLELPVVALIQVRGYDGAARQTQVFAAEVQVDGMTAVVEVLGLGHEALLGRDVLNRVTVVLQGPQKTLEITG